MRPYYSEGSKTLAYEVVEELGWKTPDRIVSPIASGSLFTKLHKGFNEWIDIGIAEGGVPVFHGAQATGCNPVATAYEEGRDFIKPVKPDTIAKSLAIGNPADGPYAVDVAKGTGGSVEQVTDDEIRAGIKLLAHTTGIFTETAGGVTIASLKKIADRGEIDPEETVVAYVTGEGLKTLDAARGTFEKYEIEPTVESFNSLVPIPVEA
jgi:threonine synthase